MNARGLNESMSETETAARNTVSMPSKHVSYVEPRSGTEAEVLGLAEDLRQAELAGNDDLFERVLTSDFVGIGPAGFVLGKREWANRHRSGDLKVNGLVRDEVALRTYGDVAILTAREVHTSTFKGQPVPFSALRATHVFVRRGGSWRLAGSQFSPIVQPPTGPVGKPQ